MNEIEQLDKIQKNFIFVDDLNWDTSNLGVVGIIYEYLSGDGISQIRHTTNGNFYLRSTTGQTACLGTTSGQNFYTDSMTWVQVLP